MSSEPQHVARVMRYSLLHDTPGESPLLHEKLYETQGEALVAALVLLGAGIGTTRVMVKRVRRVQE